MEMAYVIFVPTLGYLKDSLKAPPWYTFSDDLLEAVMFNDYEKAQTVQRFLCFSFFNGERTVTICPFPLDCRVEDLLWRNS